MSEKNRLASTRWEALSKEEKKKFEDISKAYKFPDVAEFSQEEKKKLIDRHRRQLLAEVWKKNKRFKFKFFLLVFKLMIYHGNENQQSFHTDSSPVVFLEPLQCRARCDGKVEHLVMTRALNLVRNLQCGRRT